MDTLVDVLRNVSLEHPSRVMPYRDLLTGLKNEIAEGHIVGVPHPRYPHLVMYQTTLKCYLERAWNIWTLMAKGLVLDMEGQEVVATAFLKFFDYDEMALPMEDFMEKGITVTEQIDGRMGILFYYRHGWIMTGPRSWDSPACKWAWKWLKRKLPDKIDKTNTYVFEIIPPSNMILPRFENSSPQAVLTATIDRFGLEYPYNSLVQEANYLGVPVIKAHDFDCLSDVIVAADEHVGVKEGFVAKSNGSALRTKVKGLRHSQLHDFAAQVLPLTVWESYLRGEDLEERAASLPPELRQEFVRICEHLKDSLNKVVSEIETMHKNLERKSDRQIGLMMRTHPEAFAGGKFDGDERFLFYRRKGTFYKALNDFDSLTRRRIFNLFKPKNNELPGFSSSPCITELKHVIAWV
jgi:RNA ligase